MIEGRFLKYSFFVKFWIQESEDCLGRRVECVLGLARRSRLKASKALIGLRPSSLEPLV